MTTNYHSGMIVQVPLFTDLLSKKMTPEEIRWLNEYHQTVYGKIGPLLPEEERAWLKTQTRGLTP